MWAEWLKETRKRDLKLLFKFYLKYMENDTILIASKLKVDPVVATLLFKAWISALTNRFHIFTTKVLDTI